MRKLPQRRNRAFGPNGVPTTSRRTSATRTDTTSRLPISLGSTNKTYEPSAHVRPAAQHGHLLPSFRSSERCPQLGGCRPLPRSESSIERIRILVAEQKCHFRDIHLRPVEVLVPQFLPHLHNQLPERCASIA